MEWEEIMGERLSHSSSASSESNNPGSCRLEVSFSLSEKVSGLFFFFEYSASNPMGLRERLL